MGESRVTGVEVAEDQQLADALDGANVVIAAGAAGVRVLPGEILDQAEGVEVAIDLNAVPPLGIEGVDVTDKAAERGNMIVYGAVGVGGTKMKVHRAAVEALFEENDRVLDAEAIFTLAGQL